MFNKKRSHDNRSNGFTLIEIAMAMMIIGVLLVPALQIYNITMKERKIARTDIAMDTVYAAMGKYVARNGHYPRPTHPNIPINTAGAGQEAALPILNVCAVGSTLVCRTVVGSVDTGADVETINPDPVLIGNIPYGALGIPYQSTLDGQGYSLTYAVTENLTASATFDDRWGAIEIRNDGRVAATPNVYSAGAFRGHYAIVSHGEDSRGAFNTSGSISVPCGTVADGLDFENCNNDGIFRNNIYQYDPGVNTPTLKVQISSAPGAAHFDDYVAHSNSVSTGIWSFIPNQPSIRSTQNGNVQIGPCRDTPTSAVNFPCTPRSKVSVFGNVRAEGDVKTKRICSRDPAGCDKDPTPATPYVPPQWFTPLSIGGTPPVLGEGDVLFTGAINAPDGKGLKGHKGAGFRCMNDRGFRGFYNWDEVCDDTVYVGNNPVTLGSCDPTLGQYAVGIGTDGKIICE